jgi:ankyrin repeat protein
MVHDAVLLGCKPLLLRFAAALYPEELLQRDELSGRVPLHMAAAQGSKHILQTVPQLEPRTISIRDSGGQLPLHVAIQARHE